MRPLGLIVIAAMFVFPALEFLAIAGKRDPIAVFSQFIGSTALIAMAITQLIATRLPGVEVLFGPLDRSYILHKWLAIGAFTAMMLHDTIDADIAALGRQTVLAELGETLGEISLYGLLILGVITVATFIPYHLWRWTHRLMGAFFAASFLHFLLVQKPFAVGDPLGLYISAFCVLGVLAYAYTLLPLALRRSRRYRVSGIEKTGNATAVTLRPEGPALRHRPGQFAFFRFDAAGLTEPHPFTISSAPGEDGEVRFTFRPLGDYTDRLLGGLETGMSARIQGPFGRFYPGRKGKPQVWVAGGIGVTPFAAWAGALADDASDVHLFLCAQSRATAPHLDLFEATAKRVPGFHLYLIESSQGGRLNADRIAELSGAPLEEARVHFCGPRAMRESLRQGLARKGVTPRRFHFEEFEIRTGVGLRRLSAWLWERGAPRLSELRR